MSAAKHTPGPWAACGDYPYGMTTVCDYRGGKGPYTPVAICGQGIDRPQDERDANARLIAAAPELLAALETVANSIAMGMTHNEVQAFARAAIAKATGGAA
jgi:hypothetical protein